MNDSLLKSIIKRKLQVAEKIVDHLPDEVSGKIKHFSKVILEGINECSQELGESSSKKQSIELEKITIE
jgi:hypothetical protein